MAVTAFWYVVPFKNMYSGANVIDWDTNTIKCSLHNNTYVPSQTADDFWNDATNEVTGTGYTTGGVTLTASAPTTSGNDMRLDATDATWTTVTVTARYAVVYKDTGTPSTSPLISYVNFGADQSPAGVDFTIQWDATGVAKITAS